MKEVTLVVARGTKVRIQEVDKIDDADPRVPDDRDLVVSAPGDIKIAIKRAEAGAALGAKAAVTTMCG